jgi:hypothetical protein
MKKNPYLERAAEMFKKQKMHTRFADENLLEVATSRGEKVFCFLIVEEKQFPGIIVSLAYDFHDTYIVADMMINLFYITPCALGETFYRAKDGTLYWGEEAAFRYELETMSIKDLAPPSDMKH